MLPLFCAQGVIVQSVSSPRLRDYLSTPASFVSTSFRSDAERDGAPASETHPAPLPRPDCRPIRVMPVDSFHPTVQASKPPAFRPELRTASC